MESLFSHILSLEKSHLGQSMRMDMQKLAGLLSEEFFEIGSSGFMYKRADVIQDGVVQSDMTIHNFDLKQLAEDVLLTTYFIVDQTRKRNTYRSSIWKFEENRWRLFFHQGTISPLTLQEAVNTGL